MIQLSRLNGGVIAINPDLVVWIDVTPDTTLEFLNGDRIMVRESLEEVMERVVEFRRAVRSPWGESDSHPPSAGVTAEARLASSRAPERHSYHPGGRP